jgi:hypothetical protein
MRRKKIHYTEIKQLLKHRAAVDWHIEAVIEVIVSWIFVLACAALLIFIAGRSVSAAEPSPVIFSKIFLNESDQMGDKHLNVLRGDHRKPATKINGC